MAHDEQYWSERAKSAEAQLGTLKQQIEPTLERYRAFKANFGVKEKSDGSISIDFDKFVERLGAGGCAELRKVMDEKFPGKKGDYFESAPPIGPAEVLAPLVGKTVTILAVKDGKPKLRIHRKAAA
jgi:hypothetical protein